MVVNSNDKQISFVFQEIDPFLEMGCRILEQEHIEQLLTYKRIRQNDSDIMVFSTEGENIYPLSDVLPDFNEKDIVDLLYEMVFLNRKVEENGLLGKECIWYKYDNLYYDKDKNCIMTAILPVSEEIRYEDGTDWYGNFAETMMNIAAYLPKRKSDYIKKLLDMFKTEKITDEVFLEEIDKLGCRVSQILSGQLAFDKNVTLKLLYSGKNGRVEFDINDDFLIGRNDDVADGVIPRELSKAVSRKHCLITKLNNKYFVQDLKSVNHTLVNGIMIPPYEIMELENNDILSVADIEFRVTMLVNRD